LARVAILSSVVLALGAACSGASTGPDVGPTAVPKPAAVPTLTPEPVATAVPAAPPAPTPQPGQQQPGGMHSTLPLAGEFAVTANQGDHTLSVVPIGSALVATTVQLDVAPRAISAAPNSDTVLAADSSPSGHALAVASLNASSESGTIDVGGRADQLAAPAPTDIGAPRLVLSHADDRVRSVDP